MHELNALLISKIYTEGFRPKAGGGEPAYWLPLLAPFTGARQTELGQLYVDDVRKEEFSDAAGSTKSTWIVQFAENVERKQSIKNEGSERRVPVHRQLVELGFLTFLSTVKSSNSGPLFPKIEQTIDGELMGNWSKWFGRFRKTIPEIADSKTPFHAFRHTFKHFARLSEISKDINDALTGHESGDVSDAYGALSYPLPPLVTAMDRYRVPGLVLPAPWNGAKSNLRQK